MEMGGEEIEGERKWFLVSCSARLIKTPLPALQKTIMQKRLICDAKDAMVCSYYFQFPSLYLNEYLYRNRFTMNGAEM
jgi:hypothetical protein